MINSTVLIIYLIALFLIVTHQHFNVEPQDGFLQLGFFLMILFGNMVLMFLLGMYAKYKMC